MQIHPASSHHTPAGDTSAKSADMPEANAGTGFFAQMGQILNRSEEGHGAPEESVPSAHASNSGPKNSRTSPDDAALHAARASHAKNEASQDVSGCGTPDAFSVLRIGGKSAGKAPRTGIESNPPQTKDEDMGNAGPFSQTPFAADPTAARDSAQSIITLNWKAGIEENLQLREAGGNDTAILNGRGTMEEAAAGFTTGTGIHPESRILFPAGANPGSRQDAAVAELQTENTARPRWNMEHATSTSMNDRGMSQGSEVQNGNPWKSIEVELENALRPMPRESGPSNEVASAAALENAAKSRQMNFDFSAADTFESRQQMSGPSAWISRMREPGLSNVSPDQGPAEYKSGLWNGLKNSLELEPLNPGQPKSSSRERQSPIQPVFSSSHAQSGESTGTAGGLPPQSPASQVPEVVLQLADQIRIQVRDGKGEIRIQLKPDRLGHLEIRVESTAHGVSARILTESDAVKSYLENNLQVLQQTLQEQGLKVDRIHIIIQDAFDSQASSGFTAHFGQTGTGQNGREPQVASGKTGLSAVDPIEETTLDPASWLAVHPNNRFYTIA